MLKQLTKMINKQYHIIKDALPHELCDHLIVDNFIYNKDSNLKVIPSNTNSILSNTKMSVEMVAHPCKSDLGKFFKQNARTANKQANWFFNISKIESIQILKYQFRFPLGDGYSRQVDLSAPTGKGYHQKQRKISCSLQLNEPNEYTGGELILLDIRSKENDIHDLHLNKGDLLLFPSFIPHSILPIGEGVRYCATAWIEGLSFR